MIRYLCFNQATAEATFLQPSPHTEPRATSRGFLFGRRNLADIDRIALARRKEELLRPLAKEKQIRKPESVSAKLPKQTPIDTRREAAKSAGVGERTFDKNQAARRNCTPEQYKIITGRIYNRRKKSVSNASGKNQHSVVGDQVEPQPNDKTATEVASELGISAPTVKRNGQRAAVHDAMVAIGDAVDNRQPVWPA